jgi:hypothetical protein
MPDPANRALRDLIRPDSPDFTDFLPGFENLSSRERRDLGRISDPFTGDALQNALDREFRKMERGMGAPSENDRLVSDQLQLRIRHQREQLRLELDGDPLVGSNRSRMRSLYNNLREKLGRDPSPSEVQDTANVRRRGKLGERDRCIQLGNCSQERMDALDRDIADLQARKDQLDMADRQLADNREARGMARNADNPNERPRNRPNEDLDENPDTNTPRDRDNPDEVPRNKRGKKSNDEPDEPDPKNKGLNETPTDRNYKKTLGKGLAVIAGVAVLFGLGAANIIEGAHSLMGLNPNVGNLVNGLPCECSCLRNGDQCLDIASDDSVKKHYPSFFDKETGEFTYCNRQDETSSDCTAGLCGNHFDISPGSFSTVAIIGSFLTLILYIVITISGHLPELKELKWISATLVLVVVIYLGTLILTKQFPKISEELKKLVVFTGKQVGQIKEDNIGAIDISENPFSCNDKYDPIGDLFDDNLSSYFLKGLTNSPITYSEYTSISDLSQLSLVGDFNEICGSDGSGCPLVLSNDVSSSNMVQNAENWVNREITGELIYMTQWQDPSCNYDTNRIPFKIIEDGITNNEEKCYYKDNNEDVSIKVPDINKITNNQNILDLPRSTSSDTSDNKSDLESAIDDKAPDFVGDIYRSVTSPSRIGGDLSLDENRFKTILISNQDYNDKLSSYSIIEYLQSENSNGDTVENHENLYYPNKEEEYYPCYQHNFSFNDGECEDASTYCDTTTNNLCIDKSTNVNNHQHKGRSDTLKRVDCCVRKCWKFDNEHSVDEDTKLVQECGTLMGFIAIIVIILTSLIILISVILLFRAIITFKKNRATPDDKTVLFDLIQKMAKSDEKS